MYDAIVANHMRGNGGCGINARTGRADSPGEAPDSHATVHLQPTAFRSMIEPAKMQGMARWPRWLLRLEWLFVDHIAMDPLIAPDIKRVSKRALDLGPFAGFCETISFAAAGDGQFPDGSRRDSRIGPRKLASGFLAL